jgi:hypothetical protein
MDTSAKDRIMCEMEWSVVNDKLTSNENGPIWIPFISDVVTK